ncbi:MAG: hypothetical protein CMO80_24365 [Verrucomicrobiales bacterium]|nr:hypothetical protein [Verrucomicrobiales bacterium]
MLLEKGDAHPSVPLPRWANRVLQLGRKRRTPSLHGSRLVACDTVIVGAGTAGCVLAARLSENPDRSVTLVEAGPDFQTQMPYRMKYGSDTKPSPAWWPKASTGGTRHKPGAR